jgi:DNA-binding protein HU-beta
MRIASRGGLMKACSNVIGATCLRQPVRSEHLRLVPDPKAAATVQLEIMLFSRSRALHSARRSVLNPVTSIEGTMMPKMTKSQLIDAISESSAVAKNDVKAVIENMAIVGYKELNESGEFVIPGFVKMSVVNKPATEARSGINPFTKEPMEFAAKPASKTLKASALKVAKDAV